MGQATVSPDPLDESATVTTTTTIASADDLLAQLAGEEIDRLLAESEAERATAEERAGGSVASAVAPGLRTAQPDQRDEKVSSVEPVAMSGPTAAPSALQVPTPSEPPAPADATAGVGPTTAGNHDSAFDANGVAERAALIEEAPAPVTGIAQDERQMVSEVGGPLPIYLRPLEWLNAPLASCPEGLRETLGKVAIVTLVNAIAVLAYVLLVRRP